MYIATKDVTRIGSTRLHLDVTSAINLLVYTSGGDTPGALWHIFLADDLGTLRGYLRSRPGRTRDDDPIHAQNVYLTPPMLDELRELGVRPFMVHQRLGDAVFIPAGCAHQVSTVSFG